MLLGELALEIGVAAADFVHKSSAVTVHGVTWCAVVYRSATDVQLTIQHWCFRSEHQQVPPSNRWYKAGHVGQAVGLC